MGDDNFVDDYWLLNSGLGVIVHMVTQECRFVSGIDRFRRKTLADGWRHEDCLREYKVPCPVAHGSKERDMRSVKPYFPEFLKFCQICFSKKFFRYRFRRYRTLMLRKDC